MEGRRSGRRITIGTVTAGRTAATVGRCWSRRFVAGSGKSLPQQQQTERTQSRRHTRYHRRSSTNRSTTRVDELTNFDSSDTFELLEIIDLHSKTKQNNNKTAHALSTKGNKTANKINQHLGKNIWSIPFPLLFEFDEQNWIIHDRIFIPHPWHVLISHTDYLFESISFFHLFYFSKENDKKNTEGNKIWALVKIWNRKKIKLKLLCPPLLWIDSSWPHITRLKMNISWDSLVKWTTVYEYFVYEHSYRILNMKLTLTQFDWRRLWNHAKHYGAEILFEHVPPSPYPHSFPFQKHCYLLWRRWFLHTNKMYSLINF